MQQPGRMHDLQRRCDLLHVAECLRLCDALLHARLEVATRQILHRDVLVALMHAVVEDLHDERVPDGDDSRVFALQKLAAGRLITHRLAHLQRDVASQRGAGGEIHRGFFGIADQGPDRVAGNEIRRGHRIGCGTRGPKICRAVGLRLGGIPCLGFGFLREYREAARHPLLDAPQRDPHRGLQALRTHQALGNVVHGSQLECPHCRELVAVLGEDDDGGTDRLVAQLAQHFESDGFGVLGARPEGRGQQQHVAIALRKRFCQSVELKKMN